MAYRFALASVLRVRELAAQQEERTLARILGEIERLRGAIERSEVELAEAAAGRQQVFAAASLPAMHLHASYAMAQEIRARGGLLRQQLANFEELRRLQIVRYEDAYRRREVLVSLRDKHRDAWVVARTRQEGKAADEAFLARRHRDVKADDTK